MKEKCRAAIRTAAGIVCALLLCLCLSACGAAHDTVVYVSFIDVGQGDCTLIECPGGTVLVDAGTAVSRDAVLAYLQIRNVKTIDYLILTHAHDDHVGAADAVLGNFAVGCVLMPDYSGVTPTDASWTRLCRALQTCGVPVVHPAAGDTFALGKTSFSVLGPFGAADGTNADSLVVRMTYGATAVLLMADAETETEEALLSYVTADSLSAQIIKIGHHGSAGSSSAAFLAAVRPETAVISCGTGNVFGHPSAQVTERLDEYDVTVYRTDRDGTVTFALDENGYEKISK